MRNLKPLTLFSFFCLFFFFVFFFALACQRNFIKMHSIDNGCYRTGKYAVCRRGRASFSPKILQAGAVKGFSLFVFFSHWHVKGLSSKRIHWKWMCYRTRKYTVCRHVHASLSPEILQTGAMKGLSFSFCLCFFLLLFFFLLFFFFFFLAGFLVGRSTKWAIPACALI